MILTDWLLRALLFAGTTFFAAGAVVLGGGGDSDEGAAEGEGGADTGGDEGASEGDELGAESEAEGEADEEAAVDEGEAEGAAAAGGGRKISPALQAHINEIKATNPALAKELKGAIFSDQAFRQQFPGGPMEAQRTKALVEEAGGAEGIKQLRSDAQELTAIDDKVAKGDPTVLDYILTNSPDGFSRIMPKALEKFATADPEAYQHHMAGIFAATLREAGLGQVLGQLRTSLNNPAEAGKLISAIENWAKGFDTLAAKPPEKKVDPERQKLEKDRKDWESQKLTETKKAVFTDVRTYNLSAVERRLGREFAAVKQNLAAFKKSDPDAFQIMLENAYTAVDKEAVKDQAFVKQYLAALNSGERDKALQLARKRIDRIIGDPSAKNPITKIYRAFNRGGKPAAKPAAALRPGATVARPGAGNAIKLARAPQAHELDKSPGRTTNEMIDRGEAYLKDGRRVRWDW